MTLIHMYIPRSFLLISLLFASDFALEFDPLLSLSVMELVTLLVIYVDLIDGTFGPKGERT